MRAPALAANVSLVAILFVASRAPQDATSQGRSAAPSTPAGPSYEFRNGQWFTGSGFERGTRYSVNGVLQAEAPARIDSTFDLVNGYVIPPFGDAHTHNLDGAFNIDAVRGAYLREGTFYVQVLTNSRTGAERVRARFNRPCELDVSYANGGITSTLSHPFLAYEPRGMGLHNPPEWASRAAEIRKGRTRENDAYWFVDSVGAVATKWPQIMAGGPDVLKIFFLDHADSLKALPDTGLPAGRGLAPAVAAEIVRRAHASGLPVAAHVETAADFALGVDLGVDLFAHLPGYGAELPAGSKPDVADTKWDIDPAVARRAGARGIVVTPTVSWTEVGATGPDSASLIERRRALMRRNIRVLERHGVRLVVGSDRFGSTGTIEIAAMRQLGPWTDRDILRMWSETTPQSMYPRRRLGRLVPGYEASFLVLRDNPLQQFEAVKDIALRVKQGCVIG
jgi:hypothetical protein